MRLVELSGRVKFLVESRATLRPEPFQAGEKVAFIRRLGKTGVVQELQKGFHMTDSAVSELQHFGPRFSRDEYGIYLIELTSERGAKYQQFAHESELAGV